MKISTISRFFLLVLLLVSCTDRYAYVRITGFAQGGPYTVKADLSGTGLTPEYVKASVDSIFNAIDNSVSGYNKTSILSRFNAGEAVSKDSIFTSLLQLGDRYAGETGGVVDVWAAPLFDVWGFGFTPDSLPSRELIDAAKARSALHEKVNFNAIAQGYSCDLIASWLKSKGVRNMLVDVGEIYGCGVNPQGRRWSIGIDSPVDGNNTPGAELKCIYTLPEGPCGIVTSGNYRKFYVKDGKKYAHTIDPRTGYPVTHNLLSATIISSNPESDTNAADADAYATCCMVVGLDEAKKIVESSPWLEAVLIYEEDSQMKVWRSDAADDPD
ncbi:MAG: FAD:protein FMN transferase [Candidatus Cryptobacteroides sp.]